MNSLEYDDSGKAILDDIYNQPDPVDYYVKLAKLDYCIPQEAKLFFEKLISARRSIAGQQRLKFVDVGCSYGVNAALLKYDIGMDDLVEHYQQAEGLAPEAMMALDREFYDEPADPDLEFVGLDVSANAISYSERAGILDEGVFANLEEAPLKPAMAEVVGNADMIVSTGCYGYVSETSLERLYETSVEARPWMAHFVLRMFDYTPAAEMLAGHGYVTEQVGAPVRQRRFVSREEQELVLQNLAEAGVAADGLEDEGWFYAQLHVSRPAGIAAQYPISAGAR